MDEHVHNARHLFSSQKKRFEAKLNFRPRFQHLFNIKIQAGWRQEGHPVNI